MEFSCILKGKYTVFTGVLDITCERMGTCHFLRSGGTILGDR